MSQPEMQPAPAFTQTDEFQSAVAIAARAEVDKLRQELMAVAGGASVPTSAPIGGIEDMMRHLALGIAEVADQGTSRKRVAPELLAQRAAAAKRCHDLLYKARDEGRKGEYRLIAKTYLNERLLDPYRVDAGTKQPVPVEIIWSGMPNEAMLPINDTGREIFAEYKLSIGSIEKVEMADSRPFWVTAGGLVVKGEAPARRHVMAENPHELPDFEDELGLKDVNDPRARTVAILGTVHAPARRLDNGMAA